jgi:hypothetical protein
MALVAAVARFKCGACFIVESDFDESAHSAVRLLYFCRSTYVSQNEGILGMTANINVRLTNLRRTRIDIKNFRLRIMLHGTTYVSDAAQGEIHEGKFKDDKGEIRSVGQRLQNLNFNNDFPLGIEPEQPVGGWLQFSIDGQYASDADPKPSATLMIVDTLGNQHDENCKLTYKGKMLPI